MPDQIPRTPALQVLDGTASRVPLRDASGGCRVALPCHSPHPRPGSRRPRDPPCAAPRRPDPHPAGLPGQVRAPGDMELHGIELVRRFPETARVIATYPSVKETCTAFAAAGFRQEALVQGRETYPAGLAHFLQQVDTFRHADTTMRSLTEDEFLRGQERLRLITATVMAARGPDADPRRRRLAGSRSADGDRWRSRLRQLCR